MLDLTDWQNKKYTTRRGTSVRILCIDAEGDQPIVGIIDGDIERWSLNGTYNEAYSGGEYLDLINAKTKREGWVNIAKLEHFISESDPFMSGYVTSGVFSSKEEADKHHFNVGWGVDRIACFRIEWEE